MMWGGDLLILKEFYLICAHGCCIVHVLACFYHGKSASTSFLVHSSSFDYAVLQNTLFLNRNVKDFSIALFYFTMCVSDSCVNIC